MKQTTKRIITASSVVAVLGAVLTVVLLLPSEKEHTETASGDILLFDKSSLRAEDITVKNQSGEYQLLGYDYAKEEESSEEIAVIYTMQGYETSVLSKYMTDALVSECLSAAAVRVVDKSGKKYADYGLDKPASEVTIIYSDDSAIKMALGREAPDQSGIYCRIDGDKSVYLVNASSVDMFLMDKLQLFEKTLTSEMAESEDIASVSITGTGYDQPVLITYPDVMTSPYSETCSRSAFVDFGTLFFDYTASTVAAAGVKEDELAQYGLAEPYMDIKVSTTENTTVELLASQADKDGSFYFMKQGGTIVYTLSKEEADWYGASYRDFLGEYAFSVSLDNADAVDITVDGRTDHYMFRRETVLNPTYEEAVQTTLYREEEKLDNTALYELAAALSALERGEEIPATLDGCQEVFRMKVTYTDEAEDTFSLYESEAKTMIAVLNGHIENTVSADAAGQIVSQAEKLYR